MGRHRDLQFRGTVAYIAVELIDFRQPATLQGLQAGGSNTAVLEADGTENQMALELLDPAVSCQKPVSTMADTGLETAVFKKRTS